MSSEIRSLRAVALIGNEILQHGHVPVWNAACEFVELTDDEATKILDRMYRVVYDGDDIMRSMVNLSFSHSIDEEKKFSVYIPIISGSFKNIMLTDLSEFIDLMYDEGPANWLHVDILNASLTELCTTNIAYHNSVLSFEFYETGNKHTHDSAVFNDTMYTIPIAKENVIWIFNEVANYLICYG